MAQRINLAELEFDGDRILATMANMKKGIADLRAEQKALKDSGEENSLQYIKNEATLRNLSRAYNQLNGVAQSQVTIAGELLTQEQALDRALQSENVTIQNAVDNNRELRQIRNSLNATTEEGAAQIARINARLDENTQFIRENASASEQQRMDIGSYRQQITGAFSDLNIFNGGLGGFMQRAQEAGGANNLLRTSFANMREGIMGATKASLQFIATPVGAAIAVLVGLFAAGKAIFDFNMGLVEMNKQLTSLGVSKDNLSAVRSEIKATADTYEQEFNRIANAVNSVSKAFDISMTEANDRVAEGLAGLSKEQQNALLDLSGEFGVYFAQAGYDVSEYINIIKSGIEQGGEIVKKLPDAIKESNTSLKEQSQATKDALVNAFGTSFSTDLLNRIKTGQTSVKKGLEEISIQAQKTNLDQQQLAQLTADVFKGAGEDAGGAFEILKAISAATNKEMSSAAQASEELRMANERLAKVQADLFEIEGLGDVWTKLKAQGIEAMAAWLEYFASIKKDIQPLIDLIAINFMNTWAALKASVKIAFDLIAQGFRILANTIGTAVKVISALLKGDFSGALDAVKQGVINMGNIIKDTFNKIKNTILDFLKDLVDNAGDVLKYFGVDVDKVKAKLDSWKSKEVVIKAKVESNSDAERQRVENDNAKIKAALEQRVAYYQKVRDRLEAMGKDTYQADVNLMNAQLQLYKDQPAEYEKVYNQLLKLKVDHNNKVLADSVTKLKAEYDLFVAGQDGKAKELEQELKLNEQIRDKKLAIAQAEYKAAKDKSAAKIKLATDEAKINKEFIDRQTALVLANAETEYKAIIAANQSKLDANKYFNDEVLRQEIERMDRVAEAERDRLTVQYDNGKLKYEEYTAAIAKIDEDNRKQKEALTEQQRQLDDARKLTDIENARATAGADFEKDFDLRRQQLEIQYQQEIEAARKTGADTSLIDAKFAKFRTDLDEELMNKRIQFASNVYMNVATILGKQSEVGKGIAIAQTTIDTYQSATAAYKSLAGIPIVGPALGAIAAAAAVASGLANVKKINNTKMPKAERGALFSIGGRRHSAGGTKFVGEDGTQFEAEHGEIIGVMNRKAASHFMNFNNEFLNGYTPVPAYNYLATGGIVNRTPSNVNIDYDLLAQKIAAATAAANSSLPAPVVSVTDISMVATQKVKVIDAATH